MKTEFIQPTKIIDEFLEAPFLWRYFILKQKYQKDESYHPGKKSLPLDQLNEALFHQLAAKIIKHVPQKNNFERLKIQFAYTTSADPNDFPPHRDEPFYNVAGVIYLQTNPVLSAGTSFYSRDHRCTLEVKNIFNRMVIFHPGILHKQTDVFGDELENSRLTIIFFGTAT